MAVIAIVKRVCSCVLLLLLFNLRLLFRLAPPWAAVPVVAVLFAFYFMYNIWPARDKSAGLRLGVLRAGYELTVAAIACFTLEVALYLYLVLGGAALPLGVLVVNALVCAVLLAVMALNGIVRILVCSKQVGIVTKACLLLFWWVPVVNAVLLRKILGTSRAEYRFTVQKRLRNEGRREERLCGTKYPLLMVHGVFFRDWEMFNYWGRVPKELEENGATIYYGNQRSSGAVTECAEELKATIERIIGETGCEKVNIIAHSKGGLDSRYAVSALGMGKHVASLTTINTPHRGCNYVKELLDIIPQKAVKMIGKQYETLFTLLGDEGSDFMSSLQNLTDVECARLNELMPDVPGVLYQSVGSCMRSGKSAMFPLSLGYSIIRRYGGGENDGLVTVESMEWGDFLGVVRPAGKQGVSHGDMIDLTRKDIPGFDVCEFYVDLVHKLKCKGL